MTPPPRHHRSPQWHPASVRSLRRHLEMTQEQLARELGTRQQTVSEWETGLYHPRGISSRMLSLVAERAGFVYGGPDASGPVAPGPSGAGERDNTT